jgi:hypothetical protein
MPPKKKTKTAAEPAAPKKAAPKKAAPKSSTNRKAPASSSGENPSNEQRGLMRLPPELIAKVLENYRSIGNFTMVPTPTEIEEAKANAPPNSDDTEKEVDLLADEPVLKRVYLERPDTLRALSQTCVAYRRVFLPLLFERLEVCVTTRPGNPTKAFYRHISETMQRKCSGLAERPDLSEMVACVSYAS